MNSNKGFFSQQRRQGRGNAKLSEERVCLIRRMIANGADKKEIAKIFRVAHHTVQEIAGNRTWIGIE